MQPFLNSSRPIGSWATILALEPVTLTEPPTVSPQQEKPPVVSAPLTTSPASTPLAPQLPAVRSPQQSGPPSLLIFYFYNIELYFLFLQYRARDELSRLKKKDC